MSPFENKPKIMGPSDVFRDILRSYYFTPYQEYRQTTSNPQRTFFHQEDIRSTTDWPNKTCVLSHCDNMSTHHHTNEEVGGHLIWESEVYSRVGADLTLVNHFREPVVFSDTMQLSPAGSPNSTLPGAAAYTSNVMDARGTDTNDLRAALPAAADLRSRSVSRTALTSFVRGIIELGPATNASALVPHVESSAGKQTGQATGGLEAAAVTSSLEGLGTQEEKYTITQTRPDGGPKFRSAKRQAGDRSRFRPWGYI